MLCNSMLTNQKTEKKCIILQGSRNYLKSQFDWKYPSNVQRKKSFLVCTNCTRALKKAEGLPICLTKLEGWLSGMHFLQQKCVTRIAVCMRHQTSSVSGTGLSALKNNRSAPWKTVWQFHKRLKRVYHRTQQFHFQMKLKCVHIKLCI